MTSSRSSSRTRFCSVLWSRSLVTSLCSWTGFNSALRGAERRGVGLVVPLSDVIVFHTDSFGTWTFFLRARCCDTLPTCNATVYGDFWKNFLRILREGGHGSSGRLAGYTLKVEIISMSPLYLARDASV